MTPLSPRNEVSSYEGEGLGSYGHLPGGTDEFYLTILEKLPVLIWRAGLDARANYFNTAFCEFTGRSLEELLGDGWTEAIHSDDRQNAFGTYLANFADRTPFVVIYRMLRHDGEYRWLRDQGIPLFGRRGEFLGYLGTCQDITEQRETNAELERLASERTAALRATNEALRREADERAQAEARLSFLSDASMTLAQSLDYGDTLKNIAHLSVPILGDLCFIDILEADGRLNRVAWSVADPDKAQTLSRVTRFSPPVEDTRHPVSRALKTGETVVISALVDKLPEQISLSDEHAAFLREIGIHDIITVPLSARGDIFGTITVCLMKDNPRTYTSEDVALAEELGRRAATAVDNARLLWQAERARSEAEGLVADLSNQQQWLESLLDLVPIPILLIEPITARILFANRAADEMAGGTFPRAENGAEYYRYYYCTDREGRRIPDDQMPGVRAARGERLRGFEMDWHLPVGKRSLLLNSEILPAAHGNPETVIVAFDDITRLKETEKELHNALRMRDEFLSVASHELKTPITSIKAFAQLMKGKDEVVANPLVARGLRSIVDQSNRLTALVNSLLDVSRLESGQLELERELIDLAELTHDVAAQVQVLSDQHPIDIQMSDDISLKVCGDRERLRQVLTNLLENAIKYTPEGGPVLVRLAQVGPHVEVAVQDSGIGIPANQQDRVFERFYRAPNASVRHYSGLGLGLHISREIVHRHGGTIRVESTEGQGSKFIVSLPLEAGEE